eukprot:816407_1
MKSIMNEPYPHAPMPELLFGMQALEEDDHTLSMLLNLYGTNAEFLFEYMECIGIQTSIEHRKYLVSTSCDINNGEPILNNITISFKHYQLIAKQLRKLRRQFIEPLNR